MYKELYESWLNSGKLNAVELEKLKAMTEEEKKFNFGKNLEFGTAGMRGELELGTNKINVYNVRMVTQGLAEYIKKGGAEQMKRGVVISFDTRRCSDIFACEAANVLAANGVRVYLYKDVHPVPMLSFTVRELKAVAGIMITASHNPKEYNGYKVYGEDGAQMSPEATAEVVKFVNEIGSPLSDKILCGGVKRKEIKFLGAKIDRKYYKRIKELTLSKEAVKKVGKTIKLVYTPVHGSGYVPVTTILKKLGIKATPVKEQVVKDINFSTVKVPNPEYKETLSLGIELANRISADVVFGTDPDCDRLGVAIRNDEGEFEALSGNQIGILLLDYVLLRLSETGRLPKNGFVIKSFVSTGMAKSLTDAYGVELIETPVGFKYIGEKIKQFDDTGIKKFIFGFEESCGYLRGTHCRDKDGVVASMLCAEMICYYNYNKMSVFERLKELYEKYGYTADHTDSVNYKGLEAMKEMNAVVEKIRKKKFERIGGKEVEAVRDYSKPERTAADGTKEEIDISATNSLYFELDGGSFVCLRPSGTEPKLKIYYSIKAKTKEQAEKDYETVSADFATLLK